MGTGALSAASMRISICAVAEHGEHLEGAEHVKHFETGIHDRTDGANRIDMGTLLLVGAVADFQGHTEGL